jgi:AcrR family transcriptional regulator
MSVALFERRRVDLKLLRDYFHENYVLSNGVLMARSYRLGKRAENRDQTRDRIMRATMELHDLQGVATTTFADIASRAGVGNATVSRHFPSIHDLVVACGGHVWAEIQPPVPPQAAAMFEGIASTDARLVRLVEELDAFYTRGELRLRKAGHDRERLPELEGFLSAVEAGVEALVREALRLRPLPEDTIRVAIAQASFPVWSAFQKTGLPAAEIRSTMIRLLRSITELPKS